MYGYMLIWELAINEGKSKNTTMKRPRGTETHAWLFQFCTSQTFYNLITFIIKRKIKNSFG